MKQSGRIVVGLVRKLQAYSRKAADLSYELQTEQPYDKYRTYVDSEQLVHLHKPSTPE